jgi:hypothetical protein
MGTVVTVITLSTNTLTLMILTITVPKVVITDTNTGRVFILVIGVMAMKNITPMIKSWPHPNIRDLMERMILITGLTIILRREDYLPMINMATINMEEIQAMRTMTIKNMDIC